jgi:N-terminal 7TM region of histidine kinase
VTPFARPAKPPQWWGVVAWTLWVLAILGLAAGSLLEVLLRRAGRGDPLDTAVGPMVAVVSAATVGAVLAGRRPRHPVGWLLLAFALSASAAGMAGGYAPYGLQVRPGVLPAAAWVAMYYPATALTPLALLSLVLLLTPTGSLPSPRWRWWAWLTVGAPAVLLLVMPLAPRPPDSRYQAVDNPLDLRPFDGPLLLANRALLAVTALGILVSAASLVVRFRRARGVERQQLRWLVLAAALTGVGMLASVILVVAGNQVLVGWVTGVCVALLPLAIGAAVLRYRLFDLDRIISRTLAYGLLTLLLGGGYAMVVLGLGQLLGRDSPLVVAAATLAVAAVFQPARRRVQQVVDRRFNRRRHDAARIIEGFNDQLRQQVDLDTLTTDLLGVVDQIMQPTQAWLWLRQGPSTAAGETVAHQLPGRV